MESRVDSSNNDENSSIKKRLDKLAEDIKTLPPDRIKQLEKLVKSMEKKVLTIKEAAEMLNVHADTIRRAIKSGSLKAFQLNKAGNWRIPIEELERFMRGDNQ